jgi:methanogenic corrinoid protein MtbC1
MKGHPTIAKAIEADARVISNSACEHLFENHAELSSRFGDNATELWNDHLAQRIVELTTALTIGNRQLFSSGLGWSKSALEARGLTTQDLEFSLNSLRTSIAECLTPEASSAAADYIDFALRSLQQPTEQLKEESLDAGLKFERLALHYVQMVVAGNIFAGMRLILDEVNHGMRIEDAYLKVLLPAQQEVGRLWHLNQISVSEEHLVSHTTQRVMAVLSTKMPRKPDNGFTAIAGSVSGNAHDIGIRAISYLLEFEGWRTIFLGSDIPQAELASAVDGFAADVLLLSIALPAQIKASKRAIAELRENCDKSVKVLVGGNGLVGQTEVWQQIGADGYAATAQEALETALRFATDSQE